MPATVRAEGSDTRHWNTNPILGIGTGARGGDTACGRTIMPGVTGYGFAQAVNCGTCRRSLRSEGWVL